MAPKKDAIEEIPVDEAPSEVLDTTKRYEREPNPFEQSFADGQTQSGGEFDEAEAAQTLSTLNRSEAVAKRPGSADNGSAKRPRTVVPAPPVGDGSPGSASWNISPIIQEEEAKRKTFLERNRQAAHKCRERKKKWIEALQERLTKLGEENKDLRSVIVSLQDEATTLRTILQAHSNCSIPVDAAAAAAPSKTNNY